MDHKKAISVGWIVWILGSTYFLAEYFIRVSTGVLTPYLLKEFNTNAASIGLLSSYFYYSYVGMQLPVGFLVDRIGVRKLLSLSAIIFGIACLFFSVMQDLNLGYASRFLMGLVGAFAFVSTLKLITIYFPANKFAILAGITQGSGFIGAVIGAAPMAFLFEIIGWRTSYIASGALFVALGIVMLVLVRDQTSNIEINEGKAFWPDIKAVISSKQTWLNCLYIGLIYAPTEIFGEQWGTMFLNVAGNNIGIKSAAFQVSLIFIGMAIGCPLIGHIAEKRGTIKIMRSCSIACLILISSIIYGRLVLPELNYYLLCILTFIYGIFASAIIPSYSLATKINPRRTAGIAIGLTNMATVMVGAIFIPIIGEILDIISQLNPATKMLQGIERYTIDNFYIAFAIMPICFICCFLLTFFIKEPQTQVE